MSEAMERSMEASGRQCRNAVGTHFHHPVHFRGTVPATGLGTPGTGLTTTRWSAVTQAAVNLFTDDPHQMFQRRVFVHCLGSQRATAIARNGSHRVLEELLLRLLDLGNTTLMTATGKGSVQPRANDESCLVRL